VSTDDSFSSVYMALDSNDNPHVTYDGANGVMYYASWDGSNWKTQGVIMGGTPISLIIDSHNNPHVLFEGANKVTYYASGNGTNWSFQTVPAGNGYSLALDPEGNPHIAYLASNSSNPNIEELCYASWNGSNWTIQTVDSQASGLSQGVYLALNSNSNPEIMYGYNPTGSFSTAVKFATWDGSSWAIQTAFYNLGVVGNMVLDSNGYPNFISSFNSSLMYFSWNGSAWNTQIAVSNASYGNPTLALDSHNYPHIEFFNGSMMYATFTGADWNIQTVAPNNFAYGEGPLALDSSGNPHICYWVDDIQNKTAFVSQLIYTTQTPLVSQSASLLTSLNVEYIILGTFATAIIVAAVAAIMYKNRPKNRAISQQSPIKKSAFEITRE
jgi:hypothetical protein